MNRKPLFVSLCMLSLLALVLTACGGPPAPTPDVVATQAARAPAVTATLTAPVPTAKPTDTLTPKPTETLTPTATNSPTPTATNTPTLTPTYTPTPTSSPAPTSTATLTPTTRPPTRTPKPPTPTAIPLLPTPVDWEAVDWTEIARIILRGAKVHRPQLVEVKALLGQDPTDCPRLAYLLDSLANAPLYREVAQVLWDWRDRPGLEGQLWSFLDAYGELNTFKLDTYRSVSKACATGTQPTAEQREAALHWMTQTTDPIAKMDHVINNLEPVVGP